MPVSIRERLVLICAVLFLITNTAVRFYSKPVFVYGNIASLIILALIPLLLSRGMNFLVAVLVTGVMVNVLPDTIFFVPYELGVNDAISYALLLASTVIFGYKSGNNLGMETMLLLAILLIKVYAQNSLGTIGDRYICYIGDAAIYLLFAIYTGIKLMPKYVVVPAIFIAGTVNNFRDNVIGDPYNFHWGEVVAVGLVGIGAAIYSWRRKRAN